MIGKELIKINLCSLLDWCDNGAGGSQKIGSKWVVERNVNWVVKRNMDYLLEEIAAGDATEPWISMRGVGFLFTS